MGLPKERYYFNWDRDDVRRRFRDDIDWLASLGIHGKGPILVFDEIHKVRKWKQILKGIYDTYREDFQFVVTGSGRLDFFQRGGDSLAGRYDPYFLFPLSSGEIAKGEALELLSLEAILGMSPLQESLIQQWEALGGFPEPFLSGREGNMRVWWKNYCKRITEEDLRDLTRLESVDLMRQIIDQLPQRVASPLSLQSIREDVETSFATVKRYIATLNQLFLTFEVSPFSKKIHRPIKKEKKLYFFHHPIVEAPGPRFENMVGLILQKWVAEQNEKAKGEYELHYLRDQDRREVDFLVSFNGKPHFLFECKYSGTELSPSLKYYTEKLKIPGLQIIRNPLIAKKVGPHLGVASIHRLAGALG
jgi:predicted AAA+ superfamily ATPase